MIPHRLGVRKMLHFVGAESPRGLDGNGCPIWDLFSSASNKDCAALTPAGLAAGPQPWSVPDVTATEDREE